MTAKPWVFTGPMVLAIMAGRKTMSRRIMRVQPDLIFGDILDPHKWYAADHGAFCGDIDREIKPPFVPGEIRYVAERYQIEDIVDDEGIVGKYLSDNKTFSCLLTDHELKLFRDRKKPWMKTSGRFMYHSLARTWPLILRVWPERIQDISEEDVIAEGITRNDYTNRRKPLDAFISLWNSIHGPDAWDRNDMVWAVEFERTEKPE